MAQADDGPVIDMVIVSLFGMDLKRRSNRMLLNGMAGVSKIARWSGGIVSLKRLAHRVHITISASYISHQHIQNYIRIVLYTERGQAT